ncbi:MAG: hypothetical protein KDA21_09765, partial [Phycisphaerales bacterium]|nr:hypothetical protein [Phycisphaerales bacterium]
FYTNCRFDLGISVDHVILAFDRKFDAAPDTVPPDLRDRQATTLELAREFFARSKKGNVPFEPLGVAQGWSPLSYAAAVKELQKIGYRYVAVGGMVPLKTPEILASLSAINEVRRSDVRLHLLGVTRTENVQAYESLGVASIDSTSPLRQAFKDEKNNYYTPTRAYTAVRVPQVEGNAKLQKQIAAGKLHQGTARKLEQEALAAVRDLDAGRVTVDTALSALRAYDDFCGVKKDYSPAYRDVLEDMPWKSCGCEVCAQLGHHVILFRGAERNRRRGFHNTWVFYKNLQSFLGRDANQGRKQAATGAAR